MSSWPKMSPENKISTIDLVPITFTATNRSMTVGPLITLISTSNIKPISTMPAMVINEFNFIFQKR